VNVPFDKLARLRQLWTAGLSALDCGLELGLVGEPAEIREAVLEAIEAGTRRPLEDRKAAKQKREKDKAEKEELAGFGVSFDGVTGDLEGDDEIPVEQRRTVLQLTSKTCAWPVGDPKLPGFFFCGGETHNEECYCKRHCWAAYRSLSRRKSA